MGIVWNKRSRLQAFSRIREQLGIAEEDPRPERTGVVMVVLNVRSQAPPNFRNVGRVPIWIIAGLVGAVVSTAVVVVTESDTAMLLAAWFTAILTFVVLMFLSATYHVLYANEQGLTIVRVTKPRYRVKGVDVRDEPPRGGMQLEPEGRLGGYKGRYLRPEGDVFFLIRPNKEEQEWLTKQFGRPRLPARPDDG